MDKKARAAFAKLLSLYDWNIRCVARVQRNKEPEEYTCGYADAIGQVILDLGHIYGEKIGGPYHIEAYKRVANFTNADQYIKDYPKPVDCPPRRGDYA